MILSVEGKDYKVPQYLTIDKWCQLQRWIGHEFNNERIISIALDMDIQDVLKLPDKIVETCMFLLTNMMFYKDKTPIGDMIDFNSMTIGQFIDLEVYIAGHIHNHMEPVVELLWQGVEYDPDFSSHQIWFGLTKYFNFRKTIFNKYKSLFGLDRKQKDNEEIHTNTQSDVARSWYRLLLILSGNDFLKMDEASDKPLIASLNYLAYDKDQKTEELNRLKKMKK